MNKWLVLIILLIVLSFIAYKNQSFLLSKIPYGNFSSIGLIEDRGFVRVVGGEAGFALFNLPSCKTVDDLYTDQSSPRIKYVLTVDSNKIKLPDFIYKMVKVWGTVKVETKTRRPPEIVCIKAPCEATITTSTMFLDKIEFDNQSLSSCQKDYLNKFLKGYNQKL